MAKENTTFMGAEKVEAKQEQKPKASNKRKPEKKDSSETKAVKGNLSTRRK